MFPKTRERKSGIIIDLTFSSTGEKRDLIYSWNNKGDSAYETFDTETKNDGKTKNCKNKNTRKWKIKLSSNKGFNLLDITNKFGANIPKIRDKIRDKGGRINWAKILNTKRIVKKFLIL